MSQIPTEYLSHILDEVNYLKEESQELDKSQFLADETLKRAFVRSIEIIGEASKNIPDEFCKSNPQIEWRMMASVSKDSQSKFSFSILFIVCQFLSCVLV